MKAMVNLLLAGWLATATIPASAAPRSDVLTLKEGHPTEYVVVKGDTLWDISNYFLNSPWRWPELWGLNPEIENPHLIYPGDRLRLVWVDGKPRLTLDRGMTRLYPKAKVMELNKAIPAIPLKDIVAFLNDSRVMDSDLLEQAPYVLGGRNDRLISGAGDRVYARGKLEDEEGRKALYRQGSVYKNPYNDEEVLGYELRRVADVDLVSVHKDLITLEITGSDREVRQLDRVLEAEERNIDSMFYPQPGPEGLKCEVISILDGVNDAGQFNVVTINAGEYDDLVRGDVMIIKRMGETINDPVTGDTIELPAEESGILLVFKVFSRVSYGLIMHSDNVVSVGDMIVSP